MSTRGQLRMQEIIHWEHAELACMFPRAITPSDFDGWLGFTDLAGEHGGPLVVFEFKRAFAPKLNGQERAITQLRVHLRSSDWFVLVLHDAVDFHVWPSNIGSWRAFHCGCSDSEPVAVGRGCPTLVQFVSRLDPFGLVPEQLAMTDGGRT